MHVIKGLESFTSCPTGCVIAIGVFDGVHLGHQKIIRALVEEAKKADLPSLLLTFHPHPESVLSKREINLLQTLDQRLTEIGKYGIRMAVVLPFDKKFARLSAEGFIHNVILAKFKAKKIVVGDNFRFGRKREGDVKKLQKIAPRYGFSVISVPAVRRQNFVISSSLIRDQLRKGDVETANDLLGRPYEIRGKVVKGKSRGKTLGFPTANIHPANDISPPGVFIANIGIRSTIFHSVTHVGTKPTFDEPETMIESYIIDFGGDLYGESLSVMFLKKIRDEKKFETSDALSLQIKKDLDQAQEFFKKEKSVT
jgi:riboflavin kinase/FMN adenylyltransferase